MTSDGIVIGSGGSANANAPTVASSSTCCATNGGCCDQNSIVNSTATETGEGGDTTPLGGGGRSCSCRRGSDGSTSCVRGGGNGEGSPSCVEGEGGKGGCWRQAAPSCGSGSTGRGLRWCLNDSNSNGGNGADAPTLFPSTLTTCACQGAHPTRFGVGTPMRLGGRFGGWGCGGAGSSDRKWKSEERPVSASGACVCVWVRECIYMCVCVCV
eukprot:GHVU01192947.1.p2 GENE.GHVU01192947.1~~GHVU01192947.1.p2  ORF type:complete len:212 (+),score=25.50 GHVU01192947.1:494-1129(+)